jgi:hypothetical protein
MGRFTVWHWILVVVALLLLSGGSRRISELAGGLADPARHHPREANMIAIIGIAWLLAIWAVVLAFSVYFSQNMK